MIPIEEISKNLETTHKRICLIGNVDDIIKFTEWLLETGLVSNADPNSSEEIERDFDISMLTPETQEGIYRAVNAAYAAARDEISCRLRHLRGDEV